MSRIRTMTVCVTDIPKERLIRHQNGKVYLLLETFDFNETDFNDNDFSISMSLTKEESEIKDKGGEVKRIYLGNGKIW